MAQKQIKGEFRVDHILKKLKVLEGVVKEQLLLSDEMKWDEAYKKYSLFKIDEPTSLKKSLILPTYEQRVADSSNLNLVNILFD